MIQPHATVARRKPSENKRACRGRWSVGYDAHSGATMSAANLAQPASAERAPRCRSDVSTKNAHTSSPGMNVSLVWALAAY